MLFTDHFFIFYFFPLFFILFLLVRKNISLANLIIIVSSLIFYASFGIQNIPILIIPLVVDYLLGIYLYITKNKSYRKIIVALAVILNLLFLAFFKYLGFFLINSTGFLPLSFQTYLLTIQRSLLIPVGISFITFQRISYIMDIYREKISPERNFISYCTYATIFPHLIAGPIVRYSLIKKQLKKRQITALTLFEGMKYFIVGLSLKVLIADQLYKVEQVILPNIHQIHFIESLVLVFYFSLRIYTDFAGYSLMAVGLAKLMGFNFPQNFSAPYRSNNITEFWRKWNITLSSWLRDYLYISLGGNRKGKIRTYINLLITMLLGGLWHGANWNYIIWGGLHGLYLAIERYLDDRNIHLPVPTLLQTICTFILVSFTWLTFLFASPSDIFQILKNIFSLNFTLPSSVILVPLIWSIPSFILAIVWSFILSEAYIEKLKPTLRSIVMFTILFIFSLGIALLNVGVPFIYFQF